MIYLIGVNHALQHDGNPPHGGPSMEILRSLRQEFSHYLKEIILSLNLNCIAEEFNEDALQMSCASKSIAKSVALDLDICHLYCDPDKSERLSLGIVNTGQSEDFSKREKYWLTVIQSNNVGDTLFLCGADHVKSFHNLLAEHEYKSKVVIEYYKQSCFNKEDER
jgi:hypothetical protein